MTGRTHDLAAFTALTYIMANNPLPQVTFGTALVTFGATMLGGLAPDIDQPTAQFWNRLPAGSIIGRMVTPFLGGHRFVSHSLLGIALFGFISWQILQLASTILLVDMEIVWWGFMIGFVSHLIMDTFTKEGVPWLFPIPLRLGFPPLKVFRLKTGGIIEKSFIFPGLLFFNVYIFYTHHEKFLNFLHTLGR